MTRNIKTYYVSTMIFLASCSAPADKKVTSDITVDTNKTADKVIPVDSLSKTIADDGPSVLFLDMANYLDSIGFVNDTLLKNKLRTFNKYFFIITLPRHEIFDIPKHTFKQGAFNVDTATIQKQLFYKVKNIYGYSYKIKKRTDINPDGIIEEWQFDNETDADNAGVEFNRIKNVAFWFTASYIARSKNKIYAFHNRATFDRFHKMTLDRFKNRFDKIYETVPYDGK